MTDIDTMLTEHLNVKAAQAMPVADLDAVAGGHLRLDSTSLGPKRHALLVAASVIVLVGVGGLVWVRSNTDQASTQQPGPVATDAGRQSGSIEDPKAMDFSPWLSDTAAWPPNQPTQYLVFDVAALAGWTQIDQTGGHPMGSGSSYQWSSNVSDPDGTEFNLTISDSATLSGVASGDEVDINGITGTLGEGVVSWPLDDSHVAMVVEFGTAATDRVVALARSLTTTTTPTISVRQPPTPTGVRVDDARSDFVGTVDGVRWSVSAEEDGTHYVVDNVVNETQGPAFFFSPTEFVQVGNNDQCVFVAGTTPTGTTVQLALSDATTIDLPTAPSADGQWFATCIPYGLDAVAVELTASDGTQTRRRLDGPYLQPTVGSTES